MKLLQHKSLRKTGTLKFLSFLILAAIQINMIGCTGLLSRYFKETAIYEKGDLTVRGIHEPVLIKRDNLGIPFITAKNTEDLAFAIGYVNAQDRLSQMIGYKMISHGRLSEMIGPGALKLDMYMRALNLKKAGECYLNSCKEDLTNLLKIYCEGVNTYIERHIESLPPDLQLSKHTPEKWTPLDSTMLFALLNLGLAFNFHEEINAINIIQKIGIEKTPWLFPIYPDEPFPFHEIEKLKNIDFIGTEESLKKLFAIQKDILDITTLGVAASNNWVISKEKTKHHASILANDTHLPLSLPYPLPN